MRHVKLMFPRGPGRIPAFASLYRVGDEARPGPALIYIGGAIGRDEYVARSVQEPIPIRDEVASALAPAPLPRVDVLICPCPIDTRQPGEERAAGHAWLEHHWDEHLAPVLGASPTAIALVGNSAGAACALHLAVVLEARALATIGGVGVAAAAGGPALAPLIDSLAAAGWTLDVAVFRNDGDAAAAAEHLARVPPALRVHAMAPRAGVHRFASYVANGSVTAAFRFALDRLRADLGPLIG